MGGISIAKKVTILAVGAHPDDMELEAGGTLSKYAKKGSDVYHLVLTTGYKDNVSNSTKKRKDEAESAANILGIKEVIFFDYQDTELITNGKVITQVDALVEEIKPDVCISHHPFDSHQDHKSAAEIMFAVSRQGHIKNLLSGSPLPYRPNVFAFRPQFFVNITETIETKLDAIRAYKSQYERYEREELIEHIKSMAQNYGWAMGYKYAESFEVIRMDDSLWSK